jgi:hypothetical protein
VFPNGGNIKVTLLKVLTGKDEVGNPISVIESSRTIIGISISITNRIYIASLEERKEITKAVKLQSILYQNETYARISDKTYKIERVYTNGQFTELYLAESELK